MKNGFIKLYNQYADAVFRYCFLRISDREIAVDITQDAFTKYWDVLSQGEKIGNERALLFKIAKNLVIDWYRKKKAVSLEALTEDEEFVFPEESSKISLEFEAEARFLIEKIKNLSKSYQQIIYLRFVEGMNIEEISKITEITKNTVSVRIHRGLEELKKITKYDE